MLANRVAMQGLRGELLFNHALARYTSWRVGGVAECCYKPADLPDLQHFLQQLPAQEPLTWLGLGSNILVRDGGVPGTVILTLGRLNQMGLMGDSMIRAEAGVTCAKLAKLCVEQGFADGAFWAGIPGTVGGALAMNAGAYGQETWNFVTRLETVDASGTLHLREPGAFRIGYRQVMPTHAQEYFVGAYFRIAQGDKIQAQQKLKKLLQSRTNSQPIGHYSCGSVFRNPPGEHAARLIEQAGLKGHSLGGACVSSKHANFILNEGHASSRDIEQLTEHIVAVVKQQFGVTLVREYHAIGRM